MVIARDVAQWMLDQLRRNRELYQETAAFDIQQRFGEDFVYVNENGNLAIAQNVLAEFRKLTMGTVTWSRSERYWRFREKYDEPGRRQD